MDEDDRDRSNTFLSHKAVLENIIKEVGHMQDQQDNWNKNMHNFFLTEAKQQKESDRLTEKVLAAEAECRDDDSFNNWMSVRAESALGEDTIKRWYHINGLAEKTPFLALVPCPRLLSPEGQMELVKVVDSLKLQRFFVQTVPVRLPLSKLAQTFISLPFHLPRDVRVSKSSLGNLSFIGEPCEYGGDVLKLIARSPTLVSALDQTQCLFLNDHVPRVALCLHVVTIGGRCVAAEVACDLRVAARLGLVPTATEQKETKKSIEVLSSALKNFMENGITPLVKGRSFRALILGEVLSGLEPNAQIEQVPLLTTDFRFSLLNMDVLSGCELECFEQEEILVIARHMAESPTEDVLLPALRFLKCPS